MKTDGWKAQNYKENSIPQELCAMDAIEHHAFIGNEHILDIGCGDGRVTAEIAKRVPQGHVIGIDNSKSMIDSAKKTYKNLTHVKFLQSDACHFKSETSFDLVVSFSALHWLPNQLEIFKNIYDMLKPGGQLLIRTAGGESQAIVEVFEREEWKNKLNPNRAKFQAKSASEYAQMLKKCGFKDIHAITLQASSQHESRKKLINWMLTWVPYATGLSKGQDRVFSEAVADNLYRRDNKQPSEPVEVLTPLAHLEATK